MTEMRMQSKAKMLIVMNQMFIDKIELSIFFTTVIFNAYIHIYYRMDIITVSNMRTLVLYFDVDNLTYPDRLESLTLTNIFLDFRSLTFNSFFFILTDMNFSGA